MIKKAARVGLTLEMAELAFAQAQTLPGAVVEMFEQSDGLYTVTVVWDDGGAVLEAADVDAFERTPQAPAGRARALRGGAADDDELGALSKRFESNGKPGAIGFDTTGGFSYGAYQIASKTGTLARFIDFLGTAFAGLQAALQAAGGAAAGLAGTAGFKAAWRHLAATDPSFATAQHAFIQTTHYDPFAARLLATLGLDLAARSRALRNVAWSIAVQHGPANKVFANALAGKDVAAMADDAIIAAVYAERGNLMRYFPRSTPRVKEALAGRFDEEERLALAMLAQGSTLA